MVCKNVVLPEPTLPMTPTNSLVATKISVQDSNSGKDLLKNGLSCELNTKKAGFENHSATERAP